MGGRGGEEKGVMIARGRVCSIYSLSAVYMVYWSAVYTRGAAAPIPRIPKNSRSIWRQKSMRPLYLAGRRIPTNNLDPYTLHPTPYTLHPTPYTLHPKRQKAGVTDAYGRRSDLVDAEQRTPPPATEAPAPVGSMRGVS